MSDDEHRIDVRTTMTIARRAANRTGAANLLRIIASAGEVSRGFSEAAAAARSGPP